MRTFVKILCLATLFCSCGRMRPQIPSNTEDIDTVGITLEEFNKFCLEDERAEIQAFLDSVEGFEVCEDGYWFKQDTTCTSVSDTIHIGEGNKVSITYSIELLDGTICYNGSLNGIIRFVVGKREVPKGVDIAVIGKQRGDCFSLVLPYALAYGVAGDRGCITPRTPILYNLKILSVE